MLLVNTKEWINHKSRMTRSPNHTQHPTPISNRSSENHPLSGIKVVEVCQIAAGPFCAMLLGDLGADVIKIEPLSGDAMRYWPPLTDGFSENFASVNRNKRSIALDLKLPESQRVALELIKQADVLIENNRPGVMERLGLGYEAISEINPSIIYCSISAFGQTGSRAQEGAFDVTMQAISGIMSVTGEIDQAPVKCGVPLSDFGTGLYAAFHISSALFERQSTGKGKHIDASMLGCSLGMAPLQVSEFFGTNTDPKPLGSRHPRNAPYQAFRAADDYFVLAAGNQRLFELVCTLIERPELIDDKRFSDTANRARNQAELTDILEQVFADQTASHWYTLFRNAGVPTAPINKYSEALKDPQVVDMGWIQPLEFPNQSATHTFAHPVLHDGQNLPIFRRPPALNEHEIEILKEFGLDHSESNGSD